jgi:hypothetical protein
MALDERIYCAAPSCYITSLERLFATIGPQDAEQIIPGQVAFGMEHADYLTMRAPRPTLMCIASQDYFDKKGAHTTFQEAKQIFGKLGKEVRVSLFEFDDKHGFSKPRREAATRWMCNWLLDADGDFKEGDFKVFTDEELQCTRTGQVLADFKGVSAFVLNALEAKKYADQRAAFVKQPEAVRGDTIRKLLGLPKDIPAAKQISQKIHYLEDRLSTHKIVCETEKGILIPGLRFKHIQPKGPAVIYVPENGMPADGKLPKWLVEKYEKNHQEIWIFDLRGLGETAPAIAKKPSYFGVDQKETWLSLHLNRPLLGQRVLDVLSLMKMINSDHVHIVGEGVTAPIVLHAAALDARIREIQVDGPLRSWMSVVERPITYNALSSVVPGVLKHYDLPELERSLAPRLVKHREIMK